MHLVYIDESGNTGQNLKDPQQPVFALGALIVPEHHWQPLELKFMELVAEYFPGKPLDVEIHATDIRSGRGYFRTLSLNTRLTFLSASLDLLHATGLRFVCRTIEKEKYARWIETNFPRGVSINPHVVAFPLVARVVDDYLQAQGQDALGMLISDENREIVGDIKKITALLRLKDGALRLQRVIEQCFFVDSHTSALIQLCDICTFYGRKAGEAACGLPASPYDVELLAAIERIRHLGSESFQDTMRWVEEEQKKGAARG